LEPHRKQSFQNQTLFLQTKRKGVKRAWKIVKCTRQFALIAVRNAKFPSNLTAQDQYTAKSAMLREDPKDQTSAAEDLSDQIDHTEDTRQRVY
jgi:hypothetical protein